MNRKLKLMINNCIKVIPIKDKWGCVRLGRDLDKELEEQKISLAGCTSTRELPLAEEMTECIKERVANYTEPCMVLVSIEGKVYVHGDKNGNAFFYNTKYVGKDRGVFALDRDAILAQFGNYDQDYDFVLTQSVTYEFCEYPEQNALIEAHKKAYEDGESTIDPKSLECDSLIEERKWHYYQYEKGEKVAVPLFWEDD